MASTTALVTVEDVERMGSRGEGIELFYGVIREREPMSLRHGAIGADVLIDIGLHVRERALGRVFNSDTQFVLFRDPDIMVRPDAAFVRTDRLPPVEERDRICRFAPDLAVEVVSPTDRRGQVVEKIKFYLEAGTRLLWLVEPGRRTVTVFAPGREPRMLTEDDVLDGGDVLPEFHLPVRPIFRY